MEQPRKSRRNTDRWSLDQVRYHLDKPMSPKRETKSIGDVLKDVVGDFDQPVQENIRVLKSAWPKIAGAQISKHSEPGFIKDFALYIFVDHPGWIPELERHKRPLLHKLQSSYGEMEIRQILFELKHS